MYRLALAGGMLSGKSTLAKVLQQRGYFVASHSNTLVEEYCRHANLQGAEPPLTPLRVYANKNRHRTELQRFARVIGFDSATHFIDRTLEQVWAYTDVDGVDYWDPTRPVVFDSVRHPDQAIYLINLDFKVVELQVPYQERWSRSGLPEQVFRKQFSDKAEQPLPYDLVDLYLDATKPVGVLADILATADLGTGSIPQIRRENEGTGFQH